MAKKKEEAPLALPEKLTPEQIRLVANGTDKEAIAALYERLFGRNIRGCKTCQEYDAKQHLLGYAKSMEKGWGGKWRLKSIWANTVTIAGIAVAPLDDHKVAVFQQLGFDVAELVAPDDITENKDADTRTEQ